MMIAISNFVRRQTPESEFTHFEGTDEELLQLVHDGWKDRQQGYRDGVYLVPVDPQKFRTGIVKLREGDRLVGEFKARQPGEEPRKSVRVMTHGDPAASPQKMKAKRVEVILYRHDVLAENNEQSSDAEWEIISLNGAPTEDPVPMGVGTLLSNHFQVSGGTATNMTAEELVEELRKSFFYWRDKAMVAPRKD